MFENVYEKERLNYKFGLRDLCSHLVHELSKFVSNRSLTYPLLFTIFMDLLNTWDPLCNNLSLSLANIVNFGLFLSSFPSGFLKRIG